jgi:hypothetical protein
MVVAKKGNAHKTLRSKFCSCIKKVRATVNRRSLRKAEFATMTRPSGGRKRATARNKESAAIGICVRSVLGTRGKTLHHFSCKEKEALRTQAPLL